VSNTAYLLEKYRSAAPVRALSDHLAAGHKVCQAKGLVGSQRAFAIAATAQMMQPAGPHLIICEGKDEAAYLHDDLSGLMGKDQVFSFPDSFKRTNFFAEINATHVLQRSEVVSKLTARSGAASVIVTYPEALFEQVVQPEVLQKDQILIKKGERLDVDFVITVLVEYGFKRADFVYEPGQFSIRGGIVDLFSYGHELPYRIELFDDEVESIRTFDPLTQLSAENLTVVTIVPNLNTLRSHQKASLLHILPDHAVVWMTDINFLVERLGESFRKAEEFAEKISTVDSAEIREIFRDRAFVYPPSIREDIESLRTILY
jgi:transcription-repair coupling factor (superfamily II helicase)